MSVRREAWFVNSTCTAPQPPRWRISNASAGGSGFICMNGSSNRVRWSRTFAIPLANGQNVDTRVAYVATRSPISDPYARWQQAERKPNQNLIKASKTFFQPWESIHEANPLEMLERKEAVTLRPLLIMQGALDDNVLPAVQEKFVKTYKAAGGDVQFHVFEDSEHEWVAKPGPQTDRAREMVKAFIARQLRH